MLHSNLRFAGAFVQHERFVTIGCVECDRPTAHKVEQRDGKTVYTCVECRRKIEREWRQP